LPKYTVFADAAGVGSEGCHAADRSAGDTTRTDDREINFSAACRYRMLAGGEIRVASPRWLVRLMHPMQDNQMAARYEYTAVELREKYTGRRLSGDTLEKVLNEHAAEGWQVKFLTRAGGGGLNTLRIFVTFERQIDEIVNDKTPK
jgi:hypothetical protein